MKIRNTLVSIDIEDIEVLNNLIQRKELTC